MKRFYRLMLVLLLAFALAACGGDEPEPDNADTNTNTNNSADSGSNNADDTSMPSDDGMMMDMGMMPMVDPLDVSGDIVTAGSSTVFPLAERMAERFRDEGYGDNITIDSIGSGAGFERFCVAGESDISNASRPIRNSERESCAEIGRDPIEFRVGTDALAVVVSSDNDFITEVTMEELAMLFSTATNWSDVNSEWPDEPIQRFIPGTDSGTFDYFVEEVFDEEKDPILNADNLQQSEDDNVLVQGIQGSQYAIGFFGYAYYQENAGALHILAIDGVEANAANVDAGHYPLARPLYIYSDATIMEEKPQVAEFINFFLTYANEEVIDVGYFPASDTALSIAKASWLDAQGLLTLPAVDPLDVRGDIVTAGSSTVFPLSERMAERFRDEGYGDNITIDSIGSGAGFERFCVAGESDISNASRPIRNSERESCAEIGRNPLEFRVGTDALAVVVSRDNTFITGATMEELAMIFSTATNWSDVNSEWPAEPIQRFIPGTDSGTFDYFVEEVFDEEKDPILNADNLQQSEDDNVLVQGIQGSQYAIGFFGYAYYQENADALHILDIEGVEANAANVDAGSYPLARPLYVYSDATIMQEKPQVAEFINFYLTYVNEEVADAGYFPASQESLLLSTYNWFQGMHGQ
ncbi:MAG TPA: PstS family phosphate ABC transporter substrate-binding protein [Anaerolineae bacterium]|nr:PstS family phosphate ABC transporter substrate-binding protein [Anaerolineae bacterium]